MKNLIEKFMEEIKKELKANGEVTLLTSVSCESIKLQHNVEIKVTNYTLTTNRLYLESDTDEELEIGMNFTNLENEENNTNNLYYFQYENGVKITLGIL